MLRSSRHPYQATTLPQPHVRNPWTEKPESSTNSSVGSRSGHIPKTTVPPVTSEWLLPRGQTFSHQGPLLNQPALPVIVQSRGPGSAVSTVHGSSGAASTTGGIESCGGQCIACETFCYYCLQVVFVAGILTGIALTIAGSVLHESQRDGDLVVLMYIGVLLVLVCILLLSVHCCVRRNVKERKRALRMTLMDGNRREVHPSADFMSIPVQDFAGEQPYRNSFTETNLNNLDYPDNARRLLNAMPNSALHYQSRPVPSSRSGSTRVHSYDRRSHAPEVPERQPYDWNRNPPLSGPHRSMR